MKFQEVVIHSIENWEAEVCEDFCDSGDRMDYHHRARLTIHRREELARAVLGHRLSLQEAAAEFNGKCLPPTASTGR